MTLPKKALSCMRQAMRSRLRRSMLSCFRYSITSSACRSGRRSPRRSVSILLGVSDDLQGQGGAAATNFPFLATWTG